MFFLVALHNLVCKKWVRNRDRKFSKNQEGTLIIITLRENVQFATLYRDGTVIHVTVIFVTFIFMMKNTKNCAVFD